MPESFPPYTYIPGRSPHPLNDPRGHQYGRAHAAVEISRGEWWQCSEFRRGVELFNRGYFWEAHESWEQVWIALGRRGPDADFVKALIHFAAAGVKIRAGQLHGAERHLRRCVALMQEASPPELATTVRTELLQHLQDSLDTFACRFVNLEHAGDRPMAIPGFCLSGF